MNLAPCPDCGNSCSLLAQTCPRCGRPFEKGELERTALASAPPKAAQSSPVVANASPPVPTANNNAAAIGCVVVAVLLILLAIVCMSGGSNSSLRENQPRYESTREYEAPRETDITARRHAECVRQRRAAGLDTAPCAEWAKER
jgi:hypothetical protein